MNVYVPIGTTSIMRGSGIVGVEHPTIPPLVVVDYEGNRYGAVNMVTFADRCMIAADRQEADYPTIARAMMQVEGLMKIGEWDGERGRVVLDRGKTPKEMLAAWLDVDELDPKELEVSS